MTDIQTILAPVRNLSVWDRLATLPDGSTQYQVLIKWYEQQPSWSSRSTSHEVLGVGNTAEASARDALKAFGESLRASLTVLTGLLDSVERAQQP